MTFIIYISSRIRQGQPVRHADFQWNEKHGRYLYLGRELSADEFNDAAATVFNKEYRGKNFTFTPMALLGAATQADTEPEPAKQPVLPPFADEEPVKKQPRRSAAYRAEHGET